MNLTISELANKMQYALKNEYKSRKGIDLPSGFEQDQNMLFSAIARGILEYLESKQNDFISTITLSREGISTTYTVTSLDLNIGISYLSGDIDG